MCFSVKNWIVQKSLISYFSSVTLVCPEEVLRMLSSPFHFFLIKYTYIFCKNVIVQ